MKINLYILIIGLGLFFLNSCVQPTYKRTVHFSVELKGDTTVESVGVRGDFAPLSWRETLELADEDSNGVYTGSVILDSPYDFFEMKFVKNGEVFELQDQDNRKIVFDQEGATEVKAVFDQLNP
ncbi:MAG: hypothetical protein AAFY71_16595 [Bacteroidota bacterium]